MAKDQACQLFNYLHVFRCLVRVKWAKLDLTSISALQLGQITALLIVFVGIVNPVQFLNRLRQEPLQGGFGKGGS